MKSLLVAAALAVAAFIAPAQAESDIYPNHPCPTGHGCGGGHWRGGHWDGHHWRGHWEGRHGWRHGAGIILRFGNVRPYYYGDPDVIYVPRHHVKPRRVIHVTQAHVEWCYGRYRTYRAADNSFVAKGGHRRACVSPYLR